MFKRISIILLLLLAVTACSTTNSALLYSSVDNVRLALVNENSSFDDLFAPRNLFIEPKGWDQVKENEVAALCGLDVGRRPKSLAATAASLLIEPAVRLFVDSVERAIRKEIEAYSAVYQATANTNMFYRKTGSERALNWTCFRFTRATPSGTAGDPLKPEDVALDFIGQMAFSEDKGAIIVRPLRLFYARPKATKGDRFGLAITLSAESTWLQGNVGSRSSIFEQTLLSERWVINEPKVIRT